MLLSKIKKRIKCVICIFLIIFFILFFRKIFSEEYDPNGKYYLRDISFDEERLQKFFKNPTIKDYAILSKELPKKEENFFCSQFIRLFFKENFEADQIHDIYFHIWCEEIKEVFNGTEVIKSKNPIIVIDDNYEKYAVYKPNLSEEHMQKGNYFLYKIGIWDLNFNVNKIEDLSITFLGNDINCISSPEYDSYVELKFS